MTCLKISNAAVGWKAGYVHNWYEQRRLKGPGAMYLRLRGPLGRRACMQHVYSFSNLSHSASAGETHANEKLSTFWTAATAFPPIVMFVNGVLCNVSLPYQSIARTDAWPPSQLQLSRQCPSASKEHYA